MKLDTDSLSHTKKTRLRVSRQKKANKKCPFMGSR